MIASAGHRRLRIAVGLAVTVGCLAWIFARVDPHATWNAVATARPWPLVGGICALAVGYALRIARWTLLLRASSARVSFVQCAAPFLAAIGLNNLLPLRAGDIVRSFVFPSAMGVERSTAVASLFVERLWDLSVLLALVGVGVALTPELGVPPGLGWTAVAAVFLGALTTAAIARVVAHRAKHAPPTSPAEDSGAGRLRMFIVRACVDVESMSRASVLAKAAMLSCALWIAEAGVFAGVLLALDMPFTLGTAWIIAGVTTLATLVPSSPGYVGPFHLVAFWAASRLGQGEATAAAYALLAHLCLWLPTTLAGVAALGFNPRLMTSRRTRTPARQ